MYCKRLYLLATILVILLMQVACAGSVNGLSEKAYLNKVKGAWLGKCIGGAVGMPLEGWYYKDIEKKYPTIDGYTGYFTYYQVGWSGILQTVSIPKDSDWHHFNVRMKAPAFDSAATHPSPVIGMSFEYSKAPMAWEMRDVRIVRPENGIGFDSGNWQSTIGCYWSRPDTVSFSYYGERSLLKLAAGISKRFALKKDDSMLISFSARWISGDDRIGFSYDYLTNTPRKGFGPDDDTSYQIVGLHALETYGPDLSCIQIGKEWVDHVPSGLPPALAEGLALERMKSGIKPPKSGEHKIGEAIGGQMKGEIWGQICPGRPDLAAEYARRDGVVAHWRNGVYGEQFVAVMMSSAFNEKDIRKLIGIGLDHVPADSQYAEVVKEIVGKYEKGVDWHDVRNALIAKYPNMCDPVYADAGIITLALLYGKGDFSKTISIAAACGSDTDCDTATVGALVGCIIGADAIPRKWKEPIDDKFTSFAIGMENWDLTELSKRICAMGKKVLRYHGDRMKFSSDI